MGSQSPEPEFKKPYGKWSWTAPVFMIVAITFLLYVYSPPEQEITNGPVVAVSIKPLHSLISGVMNGVVKPNLILSGSASPHDYALKPSDARVIADADVVFWIGPNMEESLSKPLSTVDEKTRVVQMVRNEVDPHTWLDPARAAQMVEYAAEQLSQADPYNADRYRQNAIYMTERLEALHIELRQRLAPVRHKPFIVYHDAYEHFARAFFLNVAGAFTPTTDRQPGAKRIVAIRQLMRDTGVRCLFKEPQFDAALLSTAIEGIDGARIATMDPIGAAFAAGKEQYFSLIKSNVTAVADCLAATP
ncbi:MAG: zinc ABC transporter substrate-binding protein [Alphaproteobacteria bacterium]